MAVAKSLPGVTVSISLRDLLEANESLVRKVRQEAEREQAKRDREYGEHLIQREDARKILGNPDPSTLYRWEQRKYLTPVKIGVKVFYRQSEIDRIIKSHEER